MPGLNPLILLVCHLLSLLGDRHALVFLVVDWKGIEHRLNRMRRRGAPDRYPRIQKFQILFWGYLHETRSPTQIVRSLSRNPLARLVIGWRIPSHDAITDCLKSYEPVIEDVLCILRDRALALGIVQTAVQVEDPTSIETPFRSDPDAKWSLKRNTGKKIWYFGYGLNARIDPFSHLPLSVLFIRSKKTNLTEIRELHRKTPVLPELYLADAEFDIIDWIEQLIAENTLPVIPYNRRRYGKRMKYRIQEYSREIGVRWLKQVSRLRAEIEHSWSTDKERFGLEDIHVRGRDKVQTHTCLCLIVRYADALAVHAYRPEASVRQSFITL